MQANRLSEASHLWPSLPNDAERTPQNWNQPRLPFVRRTQSIGCGGGHMQRAFDANPQDALAHLQHGLLSRVRIARKKRLTAEDALHLNRS